MQRDSVLAVSVLGLALLACHEQRPPMTSVVQARVVRERACGPTWIKITPLGGGGYHVRACGYVTTFSCGRHVVTASKYGSTSEEQCIRESDWRPDPDAG